MSVKRLTLDRHIRLIERVLEDVIGVELINLTYDDVHIRLMRFGEEEELGAGQRLKALETKMLALQQFEARRTNARCTKGIESGGDGMNTVAERYTFNQARSFALVLFCCFGVGER